MAKIVNPAALVRIIARAANVARVPVLVCSDSNTYTFGGWQQAMAIALRRFAPICASGSLTVGAGQGGANNNNTPGLGTPNVDNWLVTSGPSLISGSYAVTGAPAPQEAVFPGSSSGRRYAYLADGVTSATQRGATIPLPHCGFDPRRAMRFHLWGAGFSTGTASLTVRYRLGVFPFTAYQIMNFASLVGVDGQRLWLTADIAADPTRSTATGGHELLWNATVNANGPQFWTGTALEIPAITTGFAVTSLLMEGGRSSASNLDYYLVRRPAHQEVIRQIRELNGADGACLVVVNYAFNDRNSAAASYEHSSLVVSATPTTVTLSGITADLSGKTLTIGYVDAAHLTQEETKTVTTWVAGTQTATVNSAFARTPLAGDVCRASASNALVRDQQGYYNDMVAMFATLRADFVPRGLTPTFLLLPGWQPLAVPDARITTYYAAAAQIAAEHADVTAVNTNELVTFEQLQDLSGFDGTHPGGHAIASIFGRVVQAATSQIAGGYGLAVREVAA